MIYIKNAIKSYKASLIQELIKAGEEDLAEIIKSDLNMAITSTLTTSFKVELLTAKHTILQTVLVTHSN